MGKFTTTTTTEWVCVDCYLAVAGYDSHETGHDMPSPFGSDETVTDVVNGSPVEECEACRADGITEWDGSDCDALDAHSEHDHDSFSLWECAGCGSSLAGDRYAVTVERTTEGE
jgi:hypothetical protein